MRDETDRALSVVSGTGMLVRSKTVCRKQRQQQTKPRYRL